MTENYNYDVRLVVGSGQLPCEIDLDALKEDIMANTDENDTPQPGLHARPNESSLPMATFYRSGCYIVRARTVDDLFETNDSLVLDEIERLGLITEDERSSIPFEIVNVVGTGKITAGVNLRALAVGLGLKHTEYEPEQFPALVYHRSKYPCTFLVFANGNIVAPGATSIDESRQAFEEFYEEISEWVDV